MSDVITDKLRLSAIFLGASVGGFIGVSTLREIPEWVQMLIRDQGSDFLVAFTVLGAVIYFSPRLISALQSQAVALSSLAESVKGLPQKDHMRFEELIIGQEMLNRSLDRVHERLDELNRDIHGKAKG